MDVLTPFVDLISHHGDQILPPEAWLEIFAFCQDSMPTLSLLQSQFPMNIYYSCRHLRKLVMACHGAFSHFSVYITRHTSLAEETRSIEDLGKSQVPPFALTLQLPKPMNFYDGDGQWYDIPFDSDVWTTFVQTITPNVTSLVLHNLCIEELKVITKARWPHLRVVTCDLVAGGSSSMARSFTRARRLTHFACHGYHSDIQIPRQNISHLALLSWPERPVVYAHDMDLSHLRVLHLEGVLCRDSPLPSLAYLSMDLPCNTAFQPFVVPFLAPTLTTLLLSFAGESSSFTFQGWEDVCMALRGCAQLKHLAIITACMDYNFARELLSSVPGVKRLECGGGFWETALFTLLCTTQYVPKLEHLLMHVCEPLPEGISPQEIAEYQPWPHLVNTMMTERTGKMRVQQLIDARSPGRAGGALKSFTFLETSADWEDVVIHFGGSGVMVATQQVASRQRLTRHCEIMMEDRDLLCWPELMPLLNTARSQRMTSLW